MLIGRYYIGMKSLGGIRRDRAWIEPCVDTYPERAEAAPAA